MVVLFRNLMDVNAFPGGCRVAPDGGLARGGVEG